MDRVGDRWWPVLGAVYFLVAVKRVRGMRLVGLVRDEQRRPRPRRPRWPIARASRRAEAEPES